MTELTNELLNAAEANMEKAIDGDDWHRARLADRALSDFYANRMDAEEIAGWADDSWGR